MKSKMKKKKQKKYLACLLAVVMLVGILPMPAYAAEEVSALSTLQEAINNADGTEENPTEITISGTIEVNKSITIPSGKYIKLVGSSPEDGLIRAEGFSFWTGAPPTHSHLLSVQGSLVLENLTIDGNNEQGGNLVFVYGDNATVVMNKGTTLTNNRTGAVDLYSQYSTQGNPCRFTMNGGTICNNSAPQGAGVWVSGYGYADFTMNDGEIRDNTATNTGGGGAIYSTANGTVTINGGKITGNTNTGSSDGGAMSIYSNLIITGGEISDNHITNTTNPGLGGGIYKSGNTTFTMTGGVVKDNSTTRSEEGGQDIYIRKGVFELGGGAQIPDGLFIERYRNSSDEVKFYILSALQTDIEIEGLSTTPSAGRVLAEGKDYTITAGDLAKLHYDSTSLMLQLDADNNRIVLDKFTYPVTYTLTNMTADGQPISVEPGKSLMTTLKPAAGWKAPETITVKVGGIELAADLYEVRPVSSGIEVYIPRNCITGNVEIIADGIALSNNANLSGISYQVDSNNTALTSDQLQQASTPEGVTIVLPHTDLGKEFAYSGSTKEDPNAKITQKSSIVDGVYTAVLTVTAEDGVTQKVYTLHLMADPEHDWGEPAWNWVEDYSGATVTFTCGIDSSHTESPAVTVTSKTTDATCTEDGETVYTATVTFNGQTYTDVQTVVIPATDHDWGEPVWNWAGDYSSATVTFTCQNDDSHTESPAVTVTSVTTDATCTEDGETVYTASVIFNGETYTDTQIKVLPATDHVPGTEWKQDENSHWNECTQCGEKLNEAAHTFVWVTDKEATATEAGSRHEECTVCGYEKAAEEIPATGTTTGNADTPQTGDNGNIALWGVLLFISGSAVLMLTANRKKQRG